MSKRLLAIDDELAILEALTAYFEVHGWEVTCATELEEAEALLEHREFDVVIVDLRLTGIQGTEGLHVVSFVKQLQPKTRVLLLTGFGTPEIEAEAKRRGADAFLAKPIPLARLAETIEALLPSAVPMREEVVERHD